MSAPTVDQDAVDRCVEALDGFDFRDVVELLVACEADRDRLAAEVEVLARALLAWKKLGDRGFGDPSDWDVYEYRGWKIQMGGCEEFFDTEFEAQAIKTACEREHGLADKVLDRAGS